MNKKEALQKIEELNLFIKQEETEWVKIGYKLRQKAPEFIRGDE